MSQNNSRQYGKIVYVEPNALNTSHNATHPYEDYAISVDLTVNIPNRIGSATDNSGTYTISLMEKELNGNTISFFNGNNGIMTSNPGSHTYYDVLKNDIDGINENLGITHIHITYNSYFYPVVTINFTDVRGAALMTPHEENYRRGKINQATGKQVYDTKIENFFSALFSFPYPEFTLSVKGFYGKKVEYSLLVSNFRSSFNNQTGNFDATVEFIGRMYGVYADIPITYLMISPYCKYGSSNNQTIWEECNFTFDNDTPVPTLLDLRDSLLLARENIKTTMDKTLADVYNKNINKQKLLQIIHNAYNSLKNDLANKFNQVIIGDELLLFPLDSNKQCKYLNEETHLAQSLFDNLTDAIDKYEKEISGVSIPKLKGFRTIDDLYNGGSNILEVTKKGLELVITYDSTNFFNKANNGTPIKNTLKDYPTIRKSLYDKLHTLQDGDSKRYTVISGIDLNKDLKKSQVEVETKLLDLKKKIDEQTSTFYENSLGFKPSIRNIFLIIMYHLEAFTKIYSRFLSNVSDTNARHLDDFGLTLNNTDIPNRRTKNIVIPPFPGIIDNNGVFTYPTADISNEVFEETVLIDSLFNTLVPISEQVDRYNKKNEEIANENIEFIPTSFCDFLLPNNPYEYVFTDKQSDIDIDWILTYFGVRCINKFIFESLNTDYLSPEVFGKLEAYNFWRVNNDISKRIISKLETNDFNADNFINFLLHTQNPYINGSACYTNEVIKSLLARSSKNELQTPRINFPVTIGRKDKSIKTFWNDSTEENAGIYSFSNGLARDNIPYKFINFIDKTDLVLWNEQFKSLDTSDLCDDNIKKTFIEVFINNSLDLFRKSDLIFFDKSNKYQQFFNVYKKDYIQGDFKYLNEVYDENLNNSYNLSSFNISKNDIRMPVFFDDSLTPEVFLINIPHNIDELKTNIRKGKTILTIPYSTKLFLGMVISKILHTNINSDESKNKLKEFLNELDSCFNDNLLLNGLIEVICALMRSEDNEYYTSTFDYNYPVTEFMSTITQHHEYFKKDFLNLSLEYEEWADINQGNIPGTFAYFKKEYCLYSQTNYVGFGSRNYGTLCHYGRLKYSDIELKSIPSDLNSDFKSVQSEAKPFTDRYDSYHYSKKHNAVTLTFNKSFRAYQELNNFFNNTSKLIFPYACGIAKYNREGDYNVFKSAFNAFKTQLLKYYKPTTQTNKSNVDENNNGISIDNKLSMYKTLKNLYDKHFANLLQSEDLFKVKSSNCETEYDRIHFIDSFYDDIGDDLMINLDSLMEIISSIISGYASGSNSGIIKSELSLYSFMSMICEKHNMMLLAMPVFNGKINGEELENMFLPLPYNKTINENTLHGPAYICFYPHQPSQHLDIPNGQYKNDGFNLTEDINDTGNFEGPTTITALKSISNDNNIRYTMPAFSVEYGSQKQSIFKNVNVNMDNPQTTEVAVATQFGLAQGKNTDVRNLAFDGQDLYHIYSNYSFSCQVEMMGCAQIQPLMYFQLNNIPMFRGAYQIIQVEHDLVPGNMTTTFKGVRINKNKIPMTKPCLNMSTFNDLINQNNLDKRKNQALASYTPLFGSASENIHVDSIDNIKHDYNSFEKQSLPITITIDKGRFDNMNPHLKNLVFAITKRMEEHNMGIQVTSACRGGNGSSDHTTGSTNCSERRKALRYQNHGCAIDLQGTDSAGKVDKQKYSVPLFHLIGTEFTTHIRQLIWEVKPGYASSQDTVSQCVHLASYGDDTKNDKCDIFVAQEVGDKWSAIKISNIKDFSNIKNNLPISFIKTLYDIASLKSDIYNSKKFNLLNFPSGKPTVQQLREWIDKLS